MEMELTKNEFGLFEVLKGIDDERERIMFYQNIFWNKAKITKNDEIIYEGIFENSALLLKIFEFVLKQKMLMDCHEISLIAQTATLINSSSAKAFISEYDKTLLENAPHLKEILSIIR